MDPAADSRKRRGRVPLGFVVLIVGIIATGLALTALFRRVATPPQLPPAPDFRRDRVRPEIGADGSIGQSFRQSTAADNGDQGAGDEARGTQSGRRTDLPVIDQSRVEGRINRQVELPPDHADRRDQAGSWRSNAKWNRSADARRRRVRRFGGTARTEGAVEAGLSWLAAHQSPDGAWDRIDFVRQCPPRNQCRGPALTRTEHSLRAGITGLATLAFLGAGYTPATGPYQRTVEDAVAALLSMQEFHGGFSDADSMAGYNDSLATLALAECYAMTRDERLVQPLRLAVLRIVNSQQKLGGWDYLPTPGSARNDTSITAWVVQALQACSAAGITVPSRALVGAALHFASASQSDGQVWYSDSGRGFELDKSSMRPVLRYGAAMSACALMSEIILGWRLEAPPLPAQQALLFTQLPSAELLLGKDRTHLHSEYYWYYGTVAAFQMGGDHWNRWNAHLRDAILPLQNRDRTAKGRKRHQFGSWKPYGLESGLRWGRWGRMGGRVYTTAICTLTLEIYYRHTPAYLEDHLVLSADDWRSYLRGVDPSQRMGVIRVLTAARFEVGEPVLLDLLRDPERDVALTAAAALASIDSPAGKAVLVAALGELAEWERRSVDRALRQIRQIEALPPASGQVRLYDEKTKIGTLQLSRAYAGMKVDILRADAPVARMEVMHRVTGGNVVVARLIEQLTGPPPASGEVAVGE